MTQQEFSEKLEELTRRAHSLRGDIGTLAAAPIENQDEARRYLETALRHAVAAEDWLKTALENA